MWSKGLTYDEAFRRVKQVRSTTRPNFSFCKQLEEWGEFRRRGKKASIFYEIKEHERRKNYVVPKRVTSDDAILDDDQVHLQFYTTECEEGEGEDRTRVETLVGANVKKTEKTRVRIRNAFER